MLVDVVSRARDKQKHHLTLNMSTRREEVYACRVVMFLLSGARVPKQQNLPNQTRPDQTNLFYLHVYSYLTNKYR